MSFQENVVPFATETTAVNGMKTNEVFHINGNGKEKDFETGYHYYGARYYDSEKINWLSVDPLSDKYPSMSPYAYCANNPVILVDPDGKQLTTHIEVQKNGNGKYKVVGGKVDGDRGIYVVDKNGKRTGQKLGEMLTNYSFMNDKGKPVENAIINLSDKSGERFLSNFMKDTPFILYYIFNGTTGKKYDFKRNGTHEGDCNYNNVKYHYRGMKISIEGKTYIASARDIGNVAAGYIAAKHGFYWGETRIAFDFLESVQNGEFSKEGKPSVSAQEIGFDIGYKQQMAKDIRESRINGWMYNKY